MRLTDKDWSEVRQRSAKEMREELIRARKAAVEELDGTLPEADFSKLVDLHEKFLELDDWLGHKSGQGVDLKEEYPALCRKHRHLSQAFGKIDELRRALETI